MTDITQTGDGRPLFSPEKAASIGRAFYEMVCLMARLRRECPWDKEQTPESLKKYILEETYEVLEAIEDQNWINLRGELGDFMFQVLFQSVIQEEAGRFDIEDVVRGLTAKMVHRHPHVFAETHVSRPEQVESNWEKLKQAEKGHPAQSLFDGFTKSLPALLESYKVGKKAAKVGFDWPEPDRVLNKIEEEIQEVRDAGQDREALQEELGDLLFAVSNLVRKHGFEPEETLRLANAKFVGRFREMERLARQDGRDFKDLDLDTQEAYWNRAKQSLAASKA